MTSPKDKKEKQVIPTGGDPSELEDVEVPEDSELQLLEQCAPPLCHLGPKWKWLVVSQTEFLIPPNLMYPLVI